MFLIFICQVLNLIALGFQPGGVCPFAVPEDIPIWLDVYVHPSGGNEFTSVKITPDELERITGTVGWCNVCKGWEEEEQNA